MSVQTTNKETRAASSGKLEIRKTSNGRTAFGYVSVWDSLSLDLGGWQERVRRGAYAESLKTHDQYVLFDHSTNNILGSVAAGTATMVEDSYGLLVTCELPNTSLGNDIATLLTRGDLCKMSVGFAVDDSGQEWTNTSNGIVRTIQKALIFEASFVAMPAFPDTSAAVRAMNRALQQTSDLATGDEDLYCSECCSLIHSACRSSKEPCSLCLKSVIRRCEKCSAAYDEINDDTSDDDTIDDEEERKLLLNINSRLRWLI
jgi:HK97 family phage prohead protease